MNNTQCEMFKDSNPSINISDDHYIGMPEYNNKKQKPPEITATFKFKNKKDFELFHRIVKTELYNNKKVFDGMQSKEKKQAWFPLPARPSSFLYVDGDIL